jgi:hypothetical protein
LKNEEIKPIWVGEETNKNPAQFLSDKFSIILYRNSATVLT